MVQLGPDFDLAVRLKALEDKVARLEANPYGDAFSTTQADGTEGLSITRDTTTGAVAMRLRHGPATAVGADGQHPTFFYMGQLDSTILPPTDTNIGQAGAVWLRSDGTLVAVLGPAGVQFYDADGNAVFATDESVGAGYGAPSWEIPLGYWNPSAPNQQFVSNSTPTDCVMVQFLIKAPTVHLGYQITTDAATTGVWQWRIITSNGTVTGQAGVMTAGSSQVTSDDIALPMLVGGFSLWNTVATLVLSMNTTSGTGRILALPEQAWQMGTVTHFDFPTGA